MTQSIVQEAREARAEIVAEFAHDRARLWVWARAQQEAEHQANQQLSASLGKTLKITGTASKLPAARKRRVLPAGASG